MSALTPENWKPHVTFDEAHKILASPGSLLETERREIEGRVQTVFTNLNAWPSLREYWLWATSEHADKTCIVFENQRYTYDDVLSRSLRCAALLRGVYGVKKGDSVVICSRNYPSYITVWWACHLLGAVAVLVNAMLPLDPLAHSITLTSPKVIFVDPERATLIEKSSMRLSGAITVLESHEGKSKSSWEGMKNLEEEMTRHKDLDVIMNDVLDTDPGVTPEDNATVLFTSGTTGLPKGVLSTQRILLSSVLMVISSMARDRLRRGEAFPPDPDPEQRAALLATPLFHTTGVSVIMSVLFAGMKTVLMRKWDVKAAARIVKTEHITLLASVPSTLSDLADATLESSIASITCGGAAMSTAVHARVRAQLPDTELSQAYGLTETNGGIVAFAGPDYALRPASVGIPLLGSDVLIVDGAHVDVPAGTPGEIWLRGPTVMKGYWGDQAATDKVLTKDGWFKSGDLGYVDEEGFLYIQDRIKDIIIRGGENIASVTVENALHQELGVFEAAAVGVPDERLGELVVALVTLKPGYKDSVTEDQLMALARKSLPRFAVPVMIMIHDGYFEHTESGKVVKSRLKDVARKEWMHRSRTISGASKL